MQPRQLILAVVFALVLSTLNLGATIAYANSDDETSLLPSIPVDLTD